MASLLIVAHAPLASALRSVALHVFPDVGGDVVALDVAASTSPEDLQRHVRHVLDDLLRRPGAEDRESEVLVLSDLFGATPCNVAQRLVLGPRVRLVTGVNLPMLLRAVTYRHEPVSALAVRATAGATQGVMQLGGTAPQTQAAHRHMPHDHEHGHHQQ